jgi:hypothetical protein
MEAAVCELRRVAKTETAALSEAEDGRAELRKALEAKDTELAKVRAELDAERRKRTDVDTLREELRKAQADVKSLRRLELTVMVADLQKTWSNVNT